ncbi:MAG TPA: entericidin A/B family lipoprotein [Candidatus Accumulibacter phosphatis]|nr:MAG: entericidin A [Candidatus Accumulibacter sp. SK-11]HAY29824.1 entericidin EcnA/B family protein [Accumulibacter sp.]HRL78035.1 entericidin A/B family lipoprotein [Candidatus Accumulibacter phosphatis]HCN69139.1 entericidin EcnA/B family protein [Accumulibacter sp.]HCV13707.1 entericidin EcnA/B family protein [Accumulibacter sp.]
MKRRSRFLLIVLAAIAVAGCNTVQGIGKDIEKGGQAIGRAAR